MNKKWRSANCRAHKVEGGRTGEGKKRGENWSWLATLLIRANLSTTKTSTSRALYEGDKGEGGRGEGKLNRKIMDWLTMPGKQGKFKKGKSCESLQRGKNQPKR